jgi:Ti-type conjugative transfer relaxase TraA
VAIYHFTAKVISRGHGRNALAAAFYRAGQRYVDQEHGRTFDYAYKSEVIHSEIMLPEGAPEWMKDRQKLWQAVEAREVRRDAQLAREVEFALPQELSQADGIRLAREFVQEEFVKRGMVADLNIHWEVDNPHAHVMLTMREVGPDGFGRKVREWNQVGLLREWREHWAERANQRLHELGIDVRIDHRSYRDQGIELEPTSHLGKAVDEMRGRGEYAERARQLEEVRERNAQRIEQNPELVLDHITRRQSTFTRHDLQREIFRYIDEGERFRNLMARLEQSPELVLLVPEVKGRGMEEPARYTTREMLRIEASLAERALELAKAQDRGADERTLKRVLERHDYLSEEQREAVRHITGERQIEALTGFAGSGKSAAIQAAREIWEEEGHRVLGAALSGIAAENLEKAAKLQSRTIASLELGWKLEREQLTERDILVLDEAGMVGSRQMERIVSEVQDRGAKLVLVGDAEQLQPIEAGAAFRAIAERVGYRELAGIRRQQQEWQREASRDFARGEPGQALELYHQHDAIHFADDRGGAKEQLIRAWSGDRAAHGAEKASLILAHTRADVRELNERARAILREREELGREVMVTVERELMAPDGTLTVQRSERDFAPGERVMFLKNDRELGVKNGTLGQVLQVDQEMVRVRVDGEKEREIEFKFSDYASLDYGYAATVHKAQGVTVERSFVLATPGMDRHLAYVSMTRHREGVELFVGRDDFRDFEALKDRLSRARLKDFTLDYAHRRGLGLDRTATPDELRLEAERELKRKTELLRQHPELGLGRERGSESDERQQTIKVVELGRELERQLPALEIKAAEKERERSEWLEQNLGEHGRQLFHDREIPEHELYQVARAMIGGPALDRAERELEQTRRQHDRAEIELQNHRYEAGYRQGFIEWALHALGDLNRDKRLSAREREAALELEAAQGRQQQIDHWLGEPAQQRLIAERVGELRRHDQELVRELRQERSVLNQVRAMQQELALCPEQQRELTLKTRSLEAGELVGDESLKRDIGAMRESRLLSEHERARQLEMERRGITPLREYRSNPRYGHDRQMTDEAWARHAAEKGLGVKHIRDELLTGQRRSQQYDYARELERVSRLAEREVQRVRGLGHGRGFGWGR